jgi:hypothetical protein
VRRRMKEIWEAKVSLKVIIFLWQMYNGKLQTAEQLKKRNWKGEENCELCGVKEVVNHIMFRCVNSIFVWIVMRYSFGWSRQSTSLEDLLFNWIGGGGGLTREIGCSSLGWG